MTSTPPRPAYRLALGVLILIVTVLLMRIGGFDLGAARDTLLRSKSTACLALLPFALLLVVDATAWALALGVSPRPAMLGRLVQSRLGIEAVSLTVPGSILVSDGIAPLVFGQSASLTVSAAVGGVAVKKWGIVFGHVIVLAIAGFVGGAFFDRVDATAQLGFSPRTTIAISCVVGLLGCAWLSSLLMSGAAERLRQTIGRVPLEWTRRLTERLVGSASRTDSHARSFFFGSRPRVIGLVLVSALVWIAESLEVYVLFRILDVGPSFASVLAMEALLTIVRSLAFFSPGGLGAQELAYLTLIPALLGGHGLEVASGFVVLRRFRDIVTIGLGYSLLAMRALSGTR